MSHGLPFQQMPGGEKFFILLVVNLRPTEGVVSKFSAVEVAHRRRIHKGSKKCRSVLVQIALHEMPGLFGTGVASRAFKMSFAVRFELDPYVIERVAWCAGRF